MGERREMAIYHLHVSVGSKAKGHSAGAKCNYILREQEYAYDRGEVVHQESVRMPEWAATAQEYWSAADEHERVNGRLYVEVEFALPQELDRAAQIELAQEFASDLTSEKGLPYTMAIHAGQGENPHCHLMISERQNDTYARSKELWFKRANRQHPEQGGAMKEQGLRAKSWLRDTREHWGRSANLAMKYAGISREHYIDHRSYRDQGIELEPQIHLGPRAAAMRMRGIETERGMLYDRIQRLREMQRQRPEQEQKIVHLRQEIQRQRVQLPSPTRGEVSCEPRRQREREQSHQSTPHNASPHIKQEQSRGDGDDKRREHEHERAAPGSVERAGVREQRSRERDRASEQRIENNETPERRPARSTPARETGRDAARVHDRARKEGRSIPEQAAHTPERLAERAPTHSGRTENSPERVRQLGDSPTRTLGGATERERTRDQRDGPRGQHREPLECSVEPGRAGLRPPHRAQYEPGTRHSVPDRAESTPSRDVEGAPGGVESEKLQRDLLRRLDALRERTAQRQRAHDLERALPQSIGQNPGQEREVSASTPPQPQSQGQGRHIEAPTSTRAPEKTLEDRLLELKMRCFNDRSQPRTPLDTPAPPNERGVILHAERFQDHTIVLLQPDQQPDRVRVLVDPPLVREVAHIQEQELLPGRTRHPKPRVVREQEPSPRLPRPGETIHFDRGIVALERNHAQKRAKELQQEIRQEQRQRGGPEFER